MVGRLTTGLHCLVQIKKIIIVQRMSFFFKKISFSLHNVLAGLHAVVSSSYALVASMHVVVTRPHVGFSHSAHSCSHPAHQCCHPAKYVIPLVGPYISEVILLFFLLLSLREYSSLNRPHWADSVIELPCQKCL